MNISSKIVEYENARLGAYLARLDADDLRDYYVEQEYQRLCSISMSLRSAMRHFNSDDMDDLLWKAAERIVDLVDEDDGQ